MTKRKVTYEQDKALAYGRQVARANQRRRVAVRQADEQAAADRARELANHVHGWTNWDYDFDAMTESRTCRICGEVERRDLRTGTFRGVFEVG